MGRINNFFIAVLFCALSACSSQMILSPDEYLDWVCDPSSGLIIEKEIGDVIYKVKYCPYDAEVIKEMKDSNEEITNESYKAKMNTQFSSQKFILEIRNTSDEGDVLATGAMSDDEYRKRIIYLSYEVANDIVLIDGNDTLYCKLAQFEQMYKSAPYVRINAIFDMSKNETSEFNGSSRPVFHDKVFVYNDVVWKNGIVKFKINAESLNKLPKLDI